MAEVRSGFLRCAFFSLLTWLLLQAAFALGETSVSFTPAAPRAGDVVDVTVTAGAETVKGVRYRLLRDGEKLFYSKKDETRLLSSFRPRKEGLYTLEVTLSYTGNRTETVSVDIPVSGTAPVQRGSSVIYSQMDGWWSTKVYAKDYGRTLQTSGCAVFAVSHALQRMGIEDDAALPDRLARDYHKCYIEGVGTGTEALVTQVGLTFGFDTRHELVRNADEIVSFFSRGDRFLLGIVSRHVVLADSLDPETRRVRIVDSFPGATFSKLKGTPVYVRGEDGSWQAIRSADEIPGIRWFFETSRFGGTEYWLDLDDCAARGLRLIRPSWLTLDTGGEKIPVSPDSFGQEDSSVLLNGEAVTVGTRDLSWQCVGSDVPLLAVTRKDRLRITDHNGKPIEKYLPLSSGSTLAVLWADTEKIYVYWRKTYGYLNREDVDLIPVS